jgi:hypothetical protein
MVLNFLTAHSLAETTPLAAQQIQSGCSLNHPFPSLLLVYFTQAHDAAELRRAQGTLSRYPADRLQLLWRYPDPGWPSWSAWLESAVAALYDDKGAYGVAGQMGDQPDVRQLLRRAIADGGRPGELPQLILLHTSPGLEEVVLAGIDAEFGATVPVVGGSAADDSVAGSGSCAGMRGGIARVRGGGALSRLPTGVPVSFRLCTHRVSRHHYRDRRAGGADHRS